MVIVSGAEARRNQLRNRCADDFRGAVAEHFFRGMIEQHDAVVSADRNDCVHRRGDDSGELCLFRMQCGGCPFAFGNFVPQRPVGCFEFRSAFLDATLERLVEGLHLLRPGKRQRHRHRGPGEDRGKHRRHSGYSLDCRVGVVMRLPDIQDADQMSHAAGNHEDSKQHE